MALGLSPVAGGIGVLAGGVGQANGHGGSQVFQQRGLDAVENGILLLLGSGGDIDGRAVDHEMRLDDAVIQFQLLMNVFQVFQGNGVARSVFQIEADGTEVQPVRVYAEVLRGGYVALLSSAFLIFYGVDLLVAVAQVELLLGLGRQESGGVFERVPAPVGHGVQRHTCLVVKRVALQAGDVDRRCKVAIAHGERAQGVGLGDDGIVARHHGLAVNLLHHVVGVVAHHLHLERSPDERANALGIVVANGFREVVGIRAVAVAALLGLGLGVDFLQGGFYLRADARAQTGHGAARGERDGLVIVHADEVVDDAAIGLDAGLAIFGAQIALTVGLQQHVGKHRRAGALQIVSLASGRVHHLVPQTRLLVLPLDHGIQILAQQFDELRAAGIVFGHGIEHLDQRHSVPALGAAPAVLRKARFLVGPEHVPVLVVGVAVQTRLRVERAVVGDGELVHGIVVYLFYSSLLLVLGRSGDGSRETAIGQTHENAVEPYLVGVDGLVPEHFVDHGAGLLLQLLHQRLHGFQVLLLGQLLVHTGDEVAGTDVVEVVVQNVVAANLALGVDHRVGVELAVVQNVLAAVAQVGVEHTFQLDAHHVAPLRLLREVEHIAFGHALHLRAGHPFRVVLVGLLRKGQAAVDVEAVEAHVARLAAHKVAFLHAVEAAVLHVNVVNVGVFLQPDDLYTVFRALAGDVFNVHVAHGGEEAPAANLVVLVVEVDLQHAFLAHAHLDVAGVDVLDDAATARVGFYAHHALQLGRVHHAVVGEHVLAATRDF